MKEGIPSCLLYLLWRSCPMAKGHSFCVATGGVKLLQKVIEVLPGCCLLSNECQDEKWLAKGYQIIRIRYIFSITDQGNVLFVFPVIARKVPELLGAAGHILLNKSVIGPSVAISKTFVQCPAFAKIFTQYLHVVALTVYVDAVFFFFFFNAEHLWV